MKPYQLVFLFTFQSPDNKMIAVANNEGIVTILNAPKLEIRFFFEGLLRAYESL